MTGATSTRATSTRATSTRATSTRATSTRAKTTSPRPPRRGARGVLAADTALAAALTAMLGVVSVVAVTLSPAPAFAQRAWGYEPAPGYVVAESRWGRGSVSGPVRPWRNGWQVRLPGGTWVDCARSCSETLRRATVDFWESTGPQSRDDGPGYFRWDFYRR